ncbi:MAG: hypothetical protein K2X82_14740 [Gemmataceae bacterium]|nr:hypothetical protein [Gemmataceae bacterium]
MAVAGYFICPHCGKRPAAGTDANGNTIFVCCTQGGERSFNDLVRLPVQPPDPSDPDAMPVLRS